MKVKIYGAGSIGNHLANASRVLGWEVCLCDIDPAALERTRTQIYPSRYGKWDDAIKLSTIDNAPRDRFDMIMIGTPPDSHMALALDALSEKPKAIMIEKPLCTPDLADADNLYKKSKEAGVRVFVGYDHLVGLAAEKVSSLISNGKFGDFQTMDIEFREHWAGIFSAHPWLSGPADTYLGFWKRGGGASGEHSHAASLWQHFAHVFGAGRVTEVSAMLDYVNADGAEYDRLSVMNFRTEKGLVGRVVQDVITLPSRKWGRIQGSKGYIELAVGYQPGVDAVSWKEENGERAEQLIKKTRPEDFILELKHISSKLASGAPSQLDLENGLDTMLVVAAAHKSAKEKRVVGINYNAGYSLKAVN